MDNFDINKMYKRLHDDYEEAFEITKNGTVKSNNENFEKVCKFLENYKTLMRADGISVGDFNIKIVGKGEIEQVNHNKKEMAKLVGVANQYYIKACRALDIQPNQEYINVIIREN
ncbi:hypothetical protein Glove_243g54 [Diversispora epigaea]|uniref:Uncharacterized protein n=1 Tax=Diversispora epigaea TaxID=1348612 RepID=A0A397IDF2_9GLOM|nr:hypothetical protein Glove_243g54 [Diversispora epigaea]